jgi:putative ABC transport system substrate-binding protein
LIHRRDQRGIDRRHFVVALAVSAFAAPLASLAQKSGKVPRVGLLIPETAAVEAGRIDALRAGLRDYGYVEGKSIVTEVRSAEGNYDRLAELAGELTRLKVDVIVAFGTKAVSAAQHATKTIPIVDPVMGDPVASGLSSSLARPGGNITGSVQFSPEAGGKRLEFLKEAIPRITRIATLTNPANAGNPLQLETLRVTANALHVEVLVLEAHTAKELANALATLAQRRVDALMVPSDTLFRAHFAEIVERAASLKLPSAGTREFAEAGGLIGYGPDPVPLYRRSAYFVDRLLKGAKPDDLPIERANTVDLVINLKTAKALGVTIPPSLAARANDLIR